MKQKLTLFELNEQIKETLFEAFPSTVWVIAEISELKENRSGHCYLELVEKVENEIIARARATIWSYTFRMLRPYFETTTGQFFTHGLKILVQVSVEYHPAYGLSLNIKDIDPAYTVGDLALQRKEIIERLQSEGIFDMNRELKLPLAPQKIAVISSKTAAGYQDFIKHLDSNEHGFKFHTHIFEAYMQGAAAVPSIIQALERIYEYEDFFDAVAIIRGGGATADLSCFDNYDLAFHVTQFPLPIITGIGHEKDDTITDMVAHTRMKTPTAVAEFFINGVERFYDRLILAEAEIIQLTREKVEQNQTRLERLAENVQLLVGNFILEKNNILVKKGNQIQRNVNRFVFLKENELSNLKFDLRSAISIWNVDAKNSLDSKKRMLSRTTGEVFFRKNNKLEHLQDRIAGNSRQRINKEQNRIAINENSVRLLNPENVLKRGYTLTLKEGKIVKSLTRVEVNDEIETQFSDGSVKSKITIKKHNGNKKDNV